MANESIDWVARAKEQAIVDIGQIPDDQRRKQDRAAKRGEVAKWRGHWDTFNPAFGMGPLKTCFGPVSTNVATVGCVDIEQWFARFGNRDAA